MRDFFAPAWTLHYEIAFYLMFGLCLLPYIGRPLLAFWVLAVFWCWRPAFTIPLFDPPALHGPQWFALHTGWYFFASYEFYFFAGLLGGWVFSAFALRRAASLWLLATGAAILLAFTPRLKWGDGYAPSDLAPLIGLAFAALILGLARLEQLGLFRCGVAARRLGAISYPLYILHEPLIIAMDQQCGNHLRLGTAGLYALAIAGLIAIYAICALVAFGFDQPLQKLLRRRSRASPRTASVALS
jgi:exopolysaccharide production protein ExoZ